MITQTALYRRMRDVREWMRALAVVETPAGRRVATTGTRGALARLRADLAPGVRFAADVPYRTVDHRGTPRSVSIDGARQLAGAAEVVLAEEMTE